MIPGARVTSITAYLRTPLFVPENGGHAPKQCMVVAGEVLEDGPSGGILAALTAGPTNEAERSTAPATLLLPMAKIDHVVYGS